MSPFTAGLLTGLTICVLSLSILGLARETFATGPLAIVARGRTGAAFDAKTSGTAAVFCMALVALSIGGAPTSIGFPRDEDRSGDASSASGSTRAHGEVAGLDGEISRMEKYLASVGRLTTVQREPSPQSQAGGLPDVDTMIAGLVKRLAAEPGDVEGWRTLGWSYLNTGRSAEALSAYEKALALAPDRQDLKDGLDAARAAIIDPKAATAGSDAIGTNSSR